jgi:hypothetical protein
MKDLLQRVIAYDSILEVFNLEGHAVVLKIVTLKVPVDRADRLPRDAVFLSTILLSIKSF